MASEFPTTTLQDKAIRQSLKTQIPWVVLSQISLCQEKFIDEFKKNGSSHITLILWI